MSLDYWLQNVCVVLPNRCAVVLSAVRLLEFNSDTLEWEIRHLLRKSHHGPLSDRSIVDLLARYLLSDCHLASLPTVMSQETGNNRCVRSLVPSFQQWPMSARILSLSIQIQNVQNPNWKQLPKNTKLHEKTDNERNEPNCVKFWVITSCPTHLFVRRYWTQYQQL